MTKIDVNNKVYYCVQLSPQGKKKGASKILSRLFMFRLCVSRKKDMSTSTRYAFVAALGGSLSSFILFMMIPVGT